MWMVTWYGKQKKRQRPDSENNMLTFSIQSICVCTCMTSMSLKSTHKQLLTAVVCGEPGLQDEESVWKKKPTLRGFSMFNLLIILFNHLHALKVKYFKGKRNRNYKYLRIMAPWARLTLFPSSQLPWSKNKSQGRQAADAGACNCQMQLTLQSWEFLPLDTGWETRRKHPIEGFALILCLRWESTDQLTKQHV